MPNFPTLRDVEIWARLLEDKVNRLNSKVALPQKIAQPTRSQIIQIGNSSQPQIDIDSNNDNGKIIHYLDHLFKKSVVADYIQSYGQSFQDPTDPLKAWNWQILGNVLRLTYLDVLSSDICQWEYNADPTNPWVLFQGSIGTDLDPLIKVHAADARILANTPAVGDVLTALDTNGNVEWTTPSGGVVNSNLSANASATLTLTTSFADVTGCSVSLNVNGVWMIQGCFCFVKPVNDTELQGQFVYDGTAQTGIVRYSLDSTATGIGTCEKTWFVTVTGQPKTAKLQAKKTGGTGTSYTDITNCAINATYLHA